MSTAFLTESAIRAWCGQLHISIELVSADPHARAAEYRLETRFDRLRGTSRDASLPPGALFQGTIDRCSDFLRGYVYGGAK